MKLRKTITAIGAALLIVAYFVASQPITPRLALVSSLSVIIFALPSYWTVVKYCGKKRGLLLLAALGSYALIIESLAIHTGFPYGNFTYTDVLGNKIFGLTPWTVAFAYPPILLLTYWYARQRHTNKWQIWFSTAFGAMLIDMVLDPAAVRLGFWHWNKPGFFYGVPLINFLGWLLTASVGGVLLHYLWGHKNLPTPALAYSGLAILWFWTTVNFWLQQWIPAAIGGLLGIVLLILLFVDKIEATRKENA